MSDDYDKKYIAQQSVSYIDQNNKEYFYYMIFTSLYFDSEEDCIKYMSHIYPSKTHNKDYVITSLLKAKKNDYLLDG